MIYSNNPVFDIWIGQISGSKSTRSGFTTFNGPCCIHNRQARPDTSRRAGIQLKPDGSCFYNCFNCAFHCGWAPGQRLSNKNRDLMEWWGVPDETIKRLNFYLWQQAEIRKMSEQEEKPAWYPAFTEMQLPPESKTLQTWVNEGCTNEKFLAGLEYLLSRGEHHFRLNDFYWSPHWQHRNRLYIPFMWQDKIVGWSGRLFDGKGVKYYSEYPHNYLFNNQVMYDHTSKFLLIAEGPFDALSIGGIGALRNTLNEDQVNWIKSTNKIPVVVPDQSSSGFELVEIAIKNGWLVSFPKWDADVEDASAATKKYGKLFTIYSILKNENITKDEIKIRSWFKILVEKSAKKTFKTNPKAS